MKKLIFATALMLLTTCGFAVDSRLELYDFTGGLLDVISPERMPAKYTPDSGNVVFDKDLGVVRRLGYSGYNTTALTGIQQVMSGFNYKKIDGNQYFIAESSNSLFQSANSGNFSILKTSFTTHSHQTYEIANDVLWGGNGVDSEWSWNGTTFISYDITNSTNMVKAKLHCWHKNRMFRAGVPGNPLTLYYSKINTTAAGAPVADPADLGNGAQWDYIPEAGDYITCLRRSITGDYLYIFTTNSTYQLIGDDPTTWRLTRINPFIGCLYDSVADYLGSNLMLFSARGLESFDGLNYTLKTTPIDNQIKALHQINISSLGLLQDTAADWGAGTGTSIDVTSTPGSVSMQNYYNILNGYGGGNQTGYYLYTFQMRQKIVPLYNCYLTSATIKFANGSAISGNVDIYLKNSLFNILVSSNITIPTSINPYNFNFICNTQLYQNCTYYIQITSRTVSALSAEVETDYGMYHPSNFILEISTFGAANDWFPNGESARGLGIFVNSIPSSATYTTQSLGNTNWASWGGITIDDSQPSGSGINYYAVTATSTYNLGTNVAFAITNNAPIPSSVGPYIQIISSFARTDATAVPLINSYNLVYYGTDYNYPCGKTFNESYYFSCATETVNSVVYRFNKNGIFEYFNNMYASCFVKYRGELYFGSSQDTGKIYKMNIANSYTDSIGNYRSWYYTPLLNCGNPIVNKNFKWFYITASRETQQYTIKYQIDNATTTWKILNPTLAPNRLNVQKIPFPASTTGRYIQLLLETTGYINIQGMSLIYEELAL